MSRRTSQARRLKSTPSPLTVAVLDDRNCFPRLTIVHPIPTKARWINCRSQIAKPVRSRLLMTVHSRVTSLVLQELDRFSIWAAKEGHPNGRRVLVISPFIFPASASWKL